MQSHSTDEFKPFFKRKEILTYGTTWMKLKDFMLN